MRNYLIKVDHLVNKLVPHYIGGPTVILTIQACLSPLQDICDKFAIKAKQSIVEASMTSQVFLFEHYLNSLFNKYLSDKNQKIIITDGFTLGTAIFNENASGVREHLILYSESEKAQKNPVFNWKDEEGSQSFYSFEVNCPAINPKLISKEEMKAMIAYQVDRYKLAGKKYIITIN